MLITLMKLFRLSRFWAVHPKRPPTPSFSTLQSRCAHCIESSVFNFIFSRFMPRHGSFLWPW